MQMPNGIANSEYSDQTALEFQTSLSKKIYHYGMNDGLMNNNPIFKEMLQSVIAVGETEADSF